MPERTQNEYREQDKIQAADHDSLIRLEGKVDQILIDIKELKDNTAGKITELDTKISGFDKRLKSLEDLRIKFIGSLITLSFALVLFGIYIRGFVEDIFKHIYGR